ncbi:MAG: hypothetical protein KBF93_08185 [Leptospiraceae bacterium]|nr:hypothetical protein [Leptospiraceae bacterium]
MKFFLGLFILFIQIISAEPRLEEIQNLQIIDIPKIPNWIRDKKTIPRFKLMILEKLNILLLDNPDEITNQAQTLLQLLSDVKDNNKDNGSSYNYLIRKKSCLLLNHFNGTKYETESYEMMKNQIQNEDNSEVAATCIQVSSLFENKKDETNKILISMLDSSLKKKKITEDDVEKVATIIEVLGKFKKKQSYLSLLKVLDSKFPTEIKNKAKQILEMLPQ